VSDIEDQEPQGLIWDGQNYSCAYDSLMTILFSIWSNDTKKWNRRFKDMNRTMNVLSLGFNRAQENKSTLEMARNKVRRLLYQRKPQLFPYGQAGTSISEMAEDLLRSDNVISSSWYRCNNFKQETNMNKNLQTCVVQCPGVDCTTSECMKQLLKNQETGKTCINCGSNLDRVTRFNVIPKVLVLSVQESSVIVSKRIGIQDGNNIVVFTLKGVVYFGDFHYTSRICVDRNVWFNDGILTGKKSIHEKSLSEFKDAKLSICNDKTVSLVVYAQS